MEQQVTGAHHDERENDREKRVTIIINGRRKVVREKDLSFEEVIALTDNLPAGPNYEYTVTYQRAAGPRPEGSLVAGGKSVKIKDGTIFNVTATDKS
jgi:hypothetical protein